MYIYTYIYACIYIYTYIYTYLYIHIYVRNFFLPAGAVARRIMRCAYDVSNYAVYELAYIICI